MEDGYMYHYQTLKKNNETILVTVNDPLGVIIFFNLIRKWNRHRYKHGQKFTGWGMILIHWQASLAT